MNLTAIIRNKKGRVLSIGYNSYIKTHPLQAKHACIVNLPEKIYMHAEIHAIVSCKHLADAYSIDVIRLNRKGEPLLAKPCPICISAINATNIKVINWTSP